MKPAHNPAFRLIAGVSLLAAGLAAAPAAPAATAAPGAHLDPALISQVALGPSLALFSWDRTVSSPAEVAGYLGEKGMKPVLFEKVGVGAACVGTMSKLAALTGLPGGLAVAADQKLQTATEKSVPTTFNGSPTAVWNGLGVTGKGVAIAVLDTGLDGTHEDLKFSRRIRANVRTLVSHKDIFGPNSSGLPGCPDIWTDDPVGGFPMPFTHLENTETTSGHGTHIAGVAAGDGRASNGRFKGMAPEATLVGIGVLDSYNPRASTSDGFEFSTLTLVAGMEYVLRRNLFLSSGDPVGPPPIPAGAPVKVVLGGWVGEGLHYPYHPLYNAIRSLTDWGVSVVLPAGNEGPTPSDCSSAETCHYNPWAVTGQSTFATAPTPVIGVAATGRTSRKAVANYSSRGDLATYTFDDVVTRYAPAIAAPGTGVTATRRVGLVGVAQLEPTMGAGPEKGKTVELDLNYHTLSGTSIAAAHVAGTIALMQQAALDAKGCFLTSVQVWEILRQTATPMPGFSEAEVGAGMVDATNAVQVARAVPAVSTNEPWHCPEIPAA